MERQFRKAEAIVTDVALDLGVSIDLIKSRLRTPTVVAARKECAKRLRAETALSWREIGIVLGKPKRYDSRSMPK